MITNLDTNKLKKIFATKQDMKAMENRIIRKFNLVTDHFDNKFMDHERRISILESQTTSL